MIKQKRGKRKGGPERKTKQKISEARAGSLVAATEKNQTGRGEKKT